MRSSILFAFATLFLLGACNKPKVFTYPDKKDELTNILALPNNAQLQQDVDYAFYALLPFRKDIKVVFTNLSTIPFDEQEPVWYFVPNNTGNWASSEYAEYKQTFSSKKKGQECYLKMHFEGGIIGNGSMRMDIYENSETVTFSKILNW